MSKGPAGAPAPGALLAQGREAAVFDLGGARVLRRYLDPGRDVAREATAMVHLRAHGYPVPEVLEADGPDLVMGRVEGSTMLDDIGRRPWLLRRHARTLTDLHHRLHALPPPPGLAPRFGGGPAVLHLDLHPANVLLSPDGPVVIDWTNVAVGPPAADEAQTWLLLATSEIPAAGPQRLLLTLGRSAFLRSLLAGLDRDAAARLMPSVASARRTDPHVTDREREGIDALLDRLDGPAGRPGRGAGSR